MGGHTSSPLGEECTDQGVGSSARHRHSMCLGFCSASYQSPHHSTWHDHMVSILTYCSQKETNDKEMQLGMYHNQYLFISYEYLNLSAIQNNIPIV